MRKKILAFVFAVALLVAMAVPLFGGASSAEAIVDGFTPVECSGGSGGGGQAVSGGTIGQSSRTPLVPVTARGGHRETGEVVLSAGSVEETERLVPGGG